MATYLPVLLGSVSAVDDDSVVSDLPRGQVDYLSHEWREEDVWRSWRNMTRLKNEIANGVRLENASWRTWWKQRNGLKTVTPETLNWLKDSDVTWLYGPLHTADPVPKPSPTAAAVLDLPSTPTPTLSATVRKPILKHRSICELLISDFPLSPSFSPLESEEEDGPQILSDGAGPGSPRLPIRPPLLQTKSDTHIARWGPNRAFRRDSPPRVAPNSPGEPLVSSLLQSDSPPSSVPPGQKRKHISFNTFVEQCIAIDKPKRKRPHYSTSNPHLATFDDDGYDEDSEDGIIDEADEILFDDDRHQEPSYPQISHPNHSPPPHNVSPPSSSTSEEDEDEDEDDVLEMRVRHATTAVPRSPTRSSSSSSSSRSRPPQARSASYTPAGLCRHGRNGFIMRSPSADKELVTIALIAPTILKTKLDDDDDHSPYSLAHPHLPPYPNRTRNGHNGPHDSPVELVYVPPSYVYSATEESEDMVEDDIVTYEASLTGQLQRSEPSPRSVTHGFLVQQERDVETAGSTTDVKSARIPPGASTGRSTSGPEVIVSSQLEVPRSRSRSRSRSGSRSRTPSPNEVITTNVTPSATVVSRANVPAGSVFLAPSDPAPTRGRTASSSSLSSQGEQSRGRSITRNSSFSDRESLNAGSPDGNVGLGIGSVGIRDRERDIREGRRTAERGRDRCTRRSGSHSGSGSNTSLSPENPHAAMRIVVEQPQPQPDQVPVPGMRKNCISGSSSSGSSTVTVVPARLPPHLVLDAKPITQTNYTEAPPALIPISPSCTQEEQESISRQPTPANSPILSMHPPSSLIIRHERKSSSGGSRSPSRSEDEGQQGTLVGRAVEIMSNAGAFLGSFWHSGTTAGIPS